ncbi:hypothetical protein AMS68_001387 [Peltaster fructicola]|uniref:SGNH hydrolase-type esterase domain-containing protein n=1 Tax=Peltaster fructicola TaxID=286661 RepID=A0A6H0XN01_9PEZI|nr:hypothetical protein AMS68_001387 [Peltaster fructicola]
MMSFFATSEPSPYSLLRCFNHILHNDNVLFSSIILIWYMEASTILLLAFIPIFPSKSLLSTAIPTVYFRKMKLALLTVGLAGLAAANKLVIAGFGDSYAAGRELKEPIGERLRRRLKEEHGKDYDFKNMADVAATLPDIATKQAPQMQGRVPAVVYIIAGAAEFMYIDCLYEPWADYCFNNVTQQDFVHRYKMVLDTLLEISGFDEEIPIYVIEHIPAVNARMRCHLRHHICPWDHKQYKNILDTYQYLTDWTIIAFEQWRISHDNSKFTKVKIIPMREYGETHHLMDPKPWIHGGFEFLDQDAEGKDGIVWHPNKAGTDAMADYILEDMLR